MALKSYDSYSDPTLAAMTLDGDVDAFGALFSRHRQIVRQTLSARISASPADMDDIMQETFLKALSNIRRFDPSRNFAGWIWTIAYHLFLDRRRTSHPSDRLPKDAESDAPQSQIPTPEESIIYIQQRVQIEEYISRLEPQYRLIFELRFIEEYSYEEIASRLGMNLNTVKTRISRVRKQMKEMILHMDNTSRES